MRPIARSFALWASLLLAGLETTAIAGPVGGAAPTSAGPLFQTAATTAILIDAETGVVLFAKAADDLVAPASTAKIMTAAVVFQQLAEGRLKLDDTFVVSENAWRHGGAPSGGSTMFAALNSRVQVEDLLRGLIVVSGNDAAIALAEGIAGSEQAFATMMTERARALGLTKSSFSNVWGRGEPGETVTAREMALLTRHVIATYPTYYRYFGEREFLWNKIKQSSRNPLLSLPLGADGLKTGELPEAGFGLVGSAVQNGRRLIAVLNGLKSARDRASESEKLLAWGFRAFDQKILFQPGETIGTARVFGGAQGSVPLVAEGAVSVPQPHGTVDALSARIVYQGPIPAPVEKDVVIAHLKLSRVGGEILDVPLRTAQNVPVGSFPRRAWDAGLELLAGLFRTDVFKR